MCRDGTVHAHDESGAGCGGDVHGRHQGRPHQPGAGQHPDRHQRHLHLDAGSGALGYHLFVGTTPGGKNVYDLNQGLNTSVTVNNLPISGAPLYVRLWTQFRPAGSPPTTPTRRRPPPRPPSPARRRAAPSPAPAPPSPGAPGLAPWDTACSSGRRRGQERVRPAPGAQHLRHGEQPADQRRARSTSGSGHSFSDRLAVHRLHLHGGDRRQGRPHQPGAGQHLHRHQRHLHLERREWRPGVPPVRRDDAGGKNVYA